MTMQDLESWDGTLLRVEVSGAGSPVVVLHGFTGGIAAMQPLIGPLTHAYRVVAVDLPGHGQSAAPADAGRYRAGNLYRDLDELIESLELDTPAVVGYSLGGRLGLGYACSRPRTLARLVLIGAGLGIEGEVERRARVRSDEALATLVEEEGVAAFVDAWMDRPLISGQHVAGSAAWSEARSHRLALDPKGLTGMLRGFGQGVMPPLADRLGGLDLPVLAIAGAGDAKYAAEAGRISDLARRARVALVPGAGHAPHLEQPEATAGLVLDFLAEEAEA